ncbi:MAG: class I SAM-dependent methyltransferase [Hyphomicrobiales bacterium]
MPSFKTQVLRDRIKQQLGRGPYQQVPILAPAWRWVRNRYRWIAYRGEAVYCPICDRSWRGWLRGQRWGTCPGCGAHARHRWTWLYLKHHGFLDWHGRIIEFAPNRTLTGLFRRHWPHYLTADLSDPDADLTINLIDADLPDSAFNLILCCHVLEHIPDDRAAIREIRRILDRDGLALIQVPHREHLPTDEQPSLEDPMERARRFGQHDHVRRYGYDFIDRLREVFPNVTIEYPQDLFPRDECERYGLWAIPMFQCRNRTGDAAAPLAEDRAMSRPFLHS